MVGETAGSRGAQFHETKPIVVATGGQKWCLVGRVFGPYETKPFRALGTIHHDEDHRITRGPSLRVFKQSRLGRDGAVVERVFGLCQTKPFRALGAIHHDEDHRTTRGAEFAGFQTKPIGLRRGRGGAGCLGFTKGSHFGMGGSAPRCEIGRCNILGKRKELRWRQRRIFEQGNACHSGRACIKA
jgi:hypothetical protein